MASSAPDQFDVFEIYRRFSDIKARNIRHRNDGTDVVKFSREALGELYRLIDKSMTSRDSITDQLIKLMSWLNVKEDFSEFSNFYEFVFFILRENGQKNITVKKAIAAWKLVLSGRFRLLNQWCDFVKKNQRHNISEDTWVQVLAFSRCVHEDLEGYDPGGAWPVLIDDFVEHMYRITGSSSCISHDIVCRCADPESQLFTSDDTLPGLKSFPGLKRKLHDDNQRKELDITGALSLESLSLGLNKERKDLDISGALSLESLSLGLNKERKDLDISGALSLESLSLELSNTKRRKQLSSIERNSSDSIQLTPCAVEQCLSKGFEGLLSSHSPPLQLEKRSEC